MLFADSSEAYPVLSILKAICYSPPSHTQPIFTIKYASAELIGIRIPKEEKACK